MKPNNKDIKRLETMERTVRDGLNRAVNGAVILRAIHSSGLWRASGCRTWGEYCQTRLGITAVYSYQLMRFATVLNQLVKASCKHLPETLWACRVLARIPSEEQRVATWKAALASAPITGKVNPSVLSKLVSAVVPAYKPRTESVAVRRAATFRKLQEAVAARSWKAVDKYVVALAPLV